MDSYIADFKLYFSLQYIQKLLNQEWKGMHQSLQTPQFADLSFIKYLSH
jgi:hypothetical protein